MFNGKTGVDSLVVSEVSQASAEQRAGRAGRTCPGRCLRLYTEDSYLGLQTSTVPEIQRVGLAGLVLQLKALGIDDILHFDFLSPPPYENMANALELCYALGALDEDCKLTEPVGTRLAEFPLEPQTSKMILASAEEGCAEEVITVAAMLSVQNVFDTTPEADRSKRLFAVYEGDHLTYLNGKIGNSYLVIYLYIISNFFYFDFNFFLFPFREYIIYFYIIFKLPNWVSIFFIS